MKSNVMMKKLLLPGAVLGALGLAANPALALTDIYLAAKQFSMTMPDGASVPMWGFALDPGGTCYNTTPTSARLTCVDGLTATVPGPKLPVPPGESEVRLFLTNDLPVETSIIIPGQEMPQSNLAGGTTNFGPTWDDGSEGARPNPGARVRSFGKEAAPNGGRNAYRWVTAQGRPFQPGSYLYQSGTHPQVQVQMGLYGAIAVDVTAGVAYPGVTYDAQRDLFFSEVDPALHTAVAGGTFSGSTLDYNPKYFLLNSYDPTTGDVVDVSIDTGTIPPTCIDTGLNQDDAILLRMYNAGLRELSPMLIGSHYELVAEGGKPYPFRRTQYETLLMPGSTKDAVFTPGYAGDFKLIERRLNLTDNAVTGGGMQTCLSIVGPNQPPVVTNPGDQTNNTGDTVSLQIVATDDPGQTLSYSNPDASLPAGLSIDANGLITGTPTTVQAAAPVTVTVTDDGTPMESTEVMFNWTVTAPPATTNLYFSTTGNAAVPGVAGTNDDADIYLWNGTSFSRVFDAAGGTGSAGLPNNADIDALFVDAINNIFYMSFNRDLGTTVPVLGLVDDEDVVAYNANTGTWSVYFDGIAQGLGTANGYDLDALSIP